MNSYCPIFFSLQEPVATSLWIARPKPAAPGVVELDGIGLPVPALRSRRPYVSVMNPTLSAVYAKLYRADNMMPSVEKGVQAVHDRSKGEEKITHLPEIQPGWPFTPMHHSKLKFEKEATYRAAVPASSVGTAEDARNALAPFQNVRQLDCSLYYIDSEFSQRRKMLSTTTHLRHLWISESPICYTTLSTFEIKKAPTTASLFPLKRGPLQRFLRRRYVLYCSLVSFAARGRSDCCTGYFPRNSRYRNGLAGLVLILIRNIEGWTANWGGNQPTSHHATCWYLPSFPFSRQSTEYKRSRRVHSLLGYGFYSGAGSARIEQLRPKVRPSRFPWWTNKIDHVGLVLAEERMVASGDEASGCNCSLRPGNSGYDCMKKVFEISRRPDEQWVTLLQVPWMQQRHACCYRGHVALLGARLTPSFSKKHYLRILEVFARHISNA